MTTTRVDPISEDIPAVLGVPFLNLLFRRLEEYPDWLEATWDAARPVLLSPGFDAAASFVRALASPPEHQIREAALAQETRESTAGQLLHRLTDAYLHVQPRLLLLAAGWADGVQASILNNGPAHGSDKLIEVHGAATTPRVWDPYADVPMVDPSTLPAETKGVLDQMATERRHPGIASYYRSVAALPGMLELVWSNLREYVKSPQYALRRAMIVDAAVDLSSRLGLPRSVVEPTNETMSRELGDLLQAWRDLQVPELALDTAFVRGTFDAAWSGWPTYGDCPP